MTQLQLLHSTLLFTAFAITVIGQFTIFEKVTGLSILVVLTDTFIVRHTRGPSLGVIL